MSKCFCHLNGYEVKDAKARADIEAFNNSIEAMNQTIETNNENLNMTIEDVDARLTEHIVNSDVAIANLNNRADTIASSVSDIELAVENVLENGIVIIGDSFTSMDDASVQTRGGADTWVTEFSKTMNKKCYNFAEGGAGFHKPSVVDGKNHNFANQLLVASQDTSFDNSLITDIIVYGGVNDMAIGVTQEQYESALDNLAVVYKEHFPNARLHVFAFNNGSPALDGSYQHSIAEVNMINAIYRKCSDLGFVVHKATTWLDGDSSVWANALHPNVKGISRICNFMVQSFNGGDGLEIKLNIADIKLITSDGEFPITLYELNEEGIYFNPFTGILRGMINIGPRGGMNTINANFGGTYKITFDMPVVSYNSICLPAITNNLNVRLTSYIQGRGNKVMLGFDFYNGTSQQQMIDWIATSIYGHVI